MTAREQLVAACRHLAGLGLSPGGSGSLSVRDGDTLLVTPTGSSCSRVQPAELAELPLQPPSHWRPDPAAPRPSKELGLHRAVYARRTDARAMVHLHAHHTVALCCLEPTPAGTAALPALTPYQVMRLGTLPVVDYAPPGSAELAALVEEVAGDHAVILLANHGSVVAADTLDRAVDLAEELEAAARLYFTLRGIAHRELTPEDVAQLRH